MYLELIKKINENKSLGIEINIYNTWVKELNHLECLAEIKYQDCAHSSSIIIRYEYLDKGVDFSDFRKKSENDFCKDLVLIYFKRGLQKK